MNAHFKEVTAWIYKVKRTGKKINSWIAWENLKGESILKKHIKEIVLVIADMFLYFIAYSIFADKKLQFFIVNLAFLIVNEIYIYLYQKERSMNDRKTDDIPLADNRQDKDW